jgi:hypothetical protein
MEEQGQDAVGKEGGRSGKKEGRRDHQAGRIDQEGAPLKPLQEANCKEYIALGA